LRRLLAALAALTLTTACTPNLLTRWWELRATDPALAEEVAHNYLAQRAELTAGRSCAQWFDLAVEQGWPLEQWPTMARVMWGESRCDPDAYNRSGATGLMQVMPMWADDCGGAPADLYDPAFNLACALHVHEAQGWTAWSAY